MKPLSAVSLTELLRRAASEELSGNLHTVYRTTVKSVCIDQGHVVYAASSLKGDRLGETMMELGRISYDEFTLASREMRKQGKKFGQALIAAGFISEKELSHQLSLQISRIVQSLFQANEGSYRFEQRSFPPTIERNANLPIPSILLESLRRLSDISLILPGIPSANAPLRRRRCPHSDVDIRELRPLELQVMQAVGEGTSLNSIANTVPLQQRGGVLRACYTLLGAGLLEIAGPKTRTARPSSLVFLDWVRRQPDDMHGAELRYMVQKMFDLRDRVREEEFLEVDAGADCEEIAEAQTCNACRHVGISIGKRGAARENSTQCSDKIGKFKTTGGFTNGPFLDNKVRNQRNPSGRSYYSLNVGSRVCGDDGTD